MRTVEESIQSAINQLTMSDRGHLALRHICAAIPGLQGLDEYNQKAVINLLVAVWGPSRSTAAEMIRKAAESR